MRPEGDAFLHQMIWASISAETRLMLEAEDLADRGDTELAAAYQVYLDATQHLLDTRGVWGRTRAIPDVSTFEVGLAMSLELLAYARRRMWYRTGYWQSWRDGIGWRRCSSSTNVSQMAGKRGARRCQSSHRGGLAAARIRGSHHGTAVETSHSISARW
jgi:hypothetical protein